MPDKPLTPIAPADCSASPAPASKYRCPNCGGDVVPSKRGFKQFCAPKCRMQFHARMQKRGQAIMPRLQQWRRARGSGPTAKKSFQDICFMLDLWNGEDRKAGRPPLDDYCARDQAQGFDYLTRRRA